MLLKEVLPILCVATSVALSCTHYVLSATIIPILQMGKVVHGEVK